MSLFTHWVMRWTPSLATISTLPSFTLYSAANAAVAVSYTHLDVYKRQHLITCEVTHAPDLKTARAVSRSVVCYNLFKAAVFEMCIRDSGNVHVSASFLFGGFCNAATCEKTACLAGAVHSGSGGHGLVLSLIHI